MSDEKTFCGQLKVRGTQYGDVFDVLLFKADIAAIRDRWNELIDAGEDAPVRLTFLGKRDPRNDWTHYGVVDTWEPDGQRQGPPKQPESPALAAFKAGLKTRTDAPAVDALIDTDDDVIPF